MSTRAAKLFVAGLVGLSFGTRLSAAPPDPEVIAAEAAKDVRLLADPNTNRQQGAEIRLLGGGARLYPAIEAAAAHPNLPPSVAADLKFVLNYMTPLQPARLRVAAANAIISDWREKTALAAYEAGGHKNAKWDAAVKAAIPLYVRDAGESETTRTAVFHAIELGCDDPYVLSIGANCAEFAPIPDHGTADKYYKASTAGIQTANYPASIKFVADIEYAVHMKQFGQSYQELVSTPGPESQKLSALGPPPDDAGGVHARLLNPGTIGMGDSLLHKAAAIWPRVVKEPGIPAKYVETLAGQYIEAAKSPKVDRKHAFDQVYPAMAAAFPKESATLKLQGGFYVRWAWDARTGMPAKEVSKEQFALFYDRLAKAEPILTKSWKQDPYDPEAAIFMIDVALGREKDRSQMQAWFKRAIDADPDSRLAYQAQLTFLLPQWGGTPHDWVEWETEVLATMNWHGRIPLLVAELPERLETGFGDDENALKAIWHDPGTWTPIQTIYRMWLNAYPDDTIRRSRYTYLACKCGQWAEAKKQFGILGNKAVASQFEFQSVELMQQYQQEAAKH